MDVLDLCCIGAGPKTIAIFSKVACLPENIRKKLKILCVEENCVAGNWTPSGNLTNGYQNLGTRPEKDLIYPGNSKLSKLINDSNFQNELEAFTWKSYLISKYSYSNWIDMGMPNPTHFEWAKYLYWALGKALETGSSSLKLQYGKVSKIKPKGRNWIIKIENSDGKLTEIQAKRILLTGPGDQYHLSSDKSEYLLKDAWANLDILAKKKKIIVIGGGESAGSFTQALLQHAIPNLEVNIIAPKGLKVRQEGFVENKFYSNAEEHGWHRLDKEAKTTFISKSDTGVCSKTIAEKLLNDSRVTVISGYVNDIKLDSLSNKKVIAYLRDGQEISGCAVVNCTGFDNFKTIKNLYEGKFPFATRTDISVDKNFCIRSLDQDLIIPALSTISNGPGYPNLSCLGLLSDNVLEPIVNSLDK